MAGETLRWANGGYDLHLIAGTPFELASILEVLLTNTTVRWSNVATRPTGVSVTFTTGNVTFSIGNQSVTVAQADPQPGTSDPPAGHIESRTSPGVRNFIVTANITGGVPARLSLRVFLHDSLQEARISPPGLHIPASRHARFSVLGLFNDGNEGRVAGDITQHPGMTWAVTGGNTADISVASSTFTAATGLTNPDQPAQVQVTLPPLFSSGQLQATVTPIESWFRDVVAEPIGHTRRDRVKDIPNLLFLPDGFVGDDGRKKFNNAVDILTGHLSGDASCRPFDLLLSQKNLSLNMFKAWIPSFESGGTALTEVARDPAHNNKAFRVPVPIAPSGQSPNIRNLQNLIWRVGLPTKTAHLRTDFNQQMTEWVGFFGQMDPASPQLQKLWSDWRLLYPRYLGVEKDTAFGFAWGLRPQVTSTLSQRHIDFNSDRTSRDDIDPLLERFILSPDQTGLPLSQRLGAVWSETGKDRNLVVFIANAPVDAGLQTGGPNGVAISTLADSQHVLLQGPLPDDGAILDSIAPPILLSQLPPRVKARLAHELGHSFGLGDEYAEKGLNLGPVPAFNKVGNLHDDPTLRGGNPTGPFSGDNIRWGIRWKRLRAAGAMTQVPQIVTPHSYVFRLQPGHGEAFQKLTPNDRLRLRRRPLVGGAARRADEESTPFSFQSRTGDRIEASGDAVVDDYIKALAAVPPDTVILVAPLLDNGNELGLMHQGIAQHITASQSPLNRPSGIVCTIDTSNPQDSVNVPSALIATPNAPLNVKYLKRLVGLYDGGEKFGCGVYHAQAACLMRVNWPIKFEGEGTEFIPVANAVLMPFCPVCRYLLVDKLNPSLHKQIDDEYKSQYPRLP